MQQQDKCATAQDSSKLTSSIAVQSQGATASLEGSTSKKQDETTAGNRFSLNAPPRVRPSGPLAFLRGWGGNRDAVHKLGFLPAPPRRQTRPNFPSSSSHGFHPGSAPPSCLKDKEKPPPKKKKSETFLLVRPVLLGRATSRTNVATISRGNALGGLADAYMMHTCKATWEKHHSGSIVWGDAIMWVGVASGPDVAP